MLDVDDFKQYNDTYGHLVGDSVLLALSSAMRQHVEKGSDAVGRWGGGSSPISLPEDQRAAGAPGCAADSRYDGWSYGRRCNGDIHTCPNG